MSEAFAQRDPTVPCPDCGQAWLYTDVYDVCWQCGRNVENQPKEPME